MQPIRKCGHVLDGKLLLNLLRSWFSYTELSYNGAKQRMDTASFLALP
jgi:hypothetical protein